MTNNLKLFCALLGLLAGCKPDFGLPASLVTSERVLAVRSRPAEARPGDTLSFEALVGGPTGTVASAPLDWAFCGSPKAVTENNVVGAECLRGQDIRPISAQTPAASGTLPIDACLLYGPDTPPQSPGQPHQRRVTGAPNSSGSTFR